MIEVSLMMFLVTALYVFAYHYERNGNPVSIGDFGCRMIWSVAFSLGYCGLVAPHFHPLVALYMFGVGFIQILIPHAFAQRMGKRTDSWTTLKWYLWWPAIWMRPLLPLLGNTAQDFIGMGVVGLLRGLVVFAPAFFIGWCGWGAWAAVALTTLWQPTSYLVGKYTPWNIWTNSPDSSQWGEFYVPIGWALAVLVSIFAG